MRALLADDVAQHSGPQQLKTETPIDVNSPPPDSLTTPSGLRMRLLRAGQGLEHPVGADCVVLRFTAWKRDGSLQSTSGFRDETGIQCLPRAIAGVAEALNLMVEGEKRRVWVPAKLAYAHEVHMHGKKAFQLDDDGPPTVDLTFDLELVHIMKAPPAPEDLTSPPPAAIKLPSGVRLQVLEAGTGNRHPSLSDSVLLHYSTWTADGKLIETTRMSGHPGLFLIGSVLPGWLEGLQTMVVGEKARLWVPASLAFGEKPASRMQPAGNLVFDIELLAIK
jgi:peptidylprolyl isomerase